MLLTEGFFLSWGPGFGDKDRRAVGIMLRELEGRISIGLQDTGHDSGGVGDFFQTLWMGIR